MVELLNVLFNPLSNGIMTTLTGMSLLYWVFTFLSGSGVNTDVDFDGFGDVSDVDVSDGMEADAKEPSFFTKTMEFINFGKIPAMVVITLFKFVGWIITLLSSVFLGLADWGVKSILILIPVFVLTYFIMYFLTKPLVKIYKNIGYNGEEAHDFLGRTGILKSTIENKKLGILEVVINQDVIRLNVISQNGVQITYGSEVMIVKECERKVYEVVPNITLQNI